MEQPNNSILIQYVTLDDIRRMIESALDARMEHFYNTIREKPPVLIKRKDAAAILGVSLPTIDAYGKYGILHPRHIGGRVFYLEDELLAKKGRRAAYEHLPVSN